MKNRYYAGLELEKDLKFCALVKEIKASPDILILQEAEQVLVHEMKYDSRSASKRKFTGEQHVGYEYHYIVFLYEGMIFMMDVCPYYPFGDVDSPGQFRFIAYERVSKAYKKQISYPVNYEGLRSIREWMRLDKRDKIAVRGAQNQAVQIGITDFTLNVVDGVVRNHGAYREKSIWEGGSPVILKSETWNDLHKVVDIIRTDHVDWDGHRESFQVDLVTKSICG